MIFKNITFKHVNVATNQKLDNLVEQKLVSLEKYIDPSTEVRAEVEFEKFRLINLDLFVELKLMFGKRAPCLERKLQKKLSK